MASEPGPPKRGLIPVVPRKFERKTHTSTSSISALSVSSAAVDGEAHANAIELPNVAELSGSIDEATSSTVPDESPPTTAAAEAQTVTSEWPIVICVHPAHSQADGHHPIIHRGRPSVALNITFGDLPQASDIDIAEAPQLPKSEGQDSFGESHASSPTIPPSGSVTSYTHPTPFSEADKPEQEDGNGATAYQVPEERLPNGQASIPLDKIVEPYPTVNGPQAAMGAFNPVINGVPLVHNLLVSFNDPLFSDLDLELEAGGQVAKVHVHQVIVQMFPPLRDVLLRTGETQDPILDATQHASGMGIQRRTIRLTCPNPYALKAIVRMPYGGPLPAPASSPTVNVTDWASSHIANLAAAMFLKFTEVADMSAGWLIPLMEHDLSVTKLVLECIYADRTAFDHDAPPGHYRDPIKNGRFYHFKMFEAAKSAVLSGMVASAQSSVRRTLDYSAPAAPLLGGFPPAVKPVHTGTSFGHRSIHSGVLMGDVFLGPDETATTLSTILLSVPIGFLNLLTRDGRAELMLGAAIKEREVRRRSFVMQHGSGRHLPDRARWEERLELDSEGFAVVNRYEVIRF